MDGGEKEMRVTLENGVTLEFDSTGMMEDFRECSRMARESGSENGKDCKTCKCDKSLVVQGCVRFRK